MRRMLPKGHRSACCSKAGRGPFRLLSVLLLVITAIPALAGASPLLRGCPDLGIGVEVRATAISDHRAACAGVGRAIRFLGERGLTAHGPLRIVVSDQLETLHGTPVLGSFDPREGLISVPAWAVLTDGGTAATLFGLPLERELYVSIFAHEAAHAIIHALTANHRLSHAAHEYIAYTVQLATLASRLRDRILAADPAPGFSTEADINNVVLAFDPNRFAVRAYRHQQGCADPAAVLERLVTTSGQAAGAGR